LSISLLTEEVEATHLAKTWKDQETVSEDTTPNGGSVEKDVGEEYRQTIVVRIMKGNCRYDYGRLRKTKKF